MAANLLALDRQLIGDIWTSDEAYQNLARLCDDIGNRWAGSASEQRAAEFLRQRLEGYGLASVHFEPVEYQAWERGEATLQLLAPVDRAFSCIALPYSPAARLDAEVIDVGNGEAEDFERLGTEVRGRIAVSAAETNPVGRQSGALSHRSDKLRRAVDAGAVAFVFVNQNPGLLHITGGIGGPGGAPAPIPGVGVSWETGSTLLRLSRRSSAPARLRLTVSGRLFPTTSYNVVGDLPGAELDSELVIAGAHYDGHDISQGALDDGAGTVVGLEAARVLAALPASSLSRRVRFIFFSAEEVGLLGSWAYTAAHEAEASRTRFVLNLDTAGRGKGGSETLVLTGAPDLVPYFAAHARATKYELPVTHSFNSHSDHFPYALRGIPTATLSSPDNTTTLVGRGWGHTEADTVDKASVRGLQMAAMVTARLLLHVATDREFPGRRRPREEVLAQVQENGLLEPLRRTGRIELAGGAGSTTATQPSGRRDEPTEEG